MTLMDEYHREGTSEGRRREIEDELDGLPRKTAEANRDNAFGIMALEGMAPTLSGQELLDRIAEFLPGMQKSRELAALRTVAAQRLKTDIGQPYMNIMQGDADGQIVTLTSVIDNPANKYTLVDFWASWCGPCMEEVPHLKQAYDKFHGRASKYTAYRWTTTTTNGSAPSASTAWAGCRSATSTASTTSRRKTMPCKASRRIS